ncbi:hypothetical protein T484DRAFT_1762201 [Baffinella frigidus]|nr:hypothetical protein T484DRAFT_1762201 [Cryptophyta sp. CCMP2293]
MATGNHYRVALDEADFIRARSASFSYARPVPQDMESGGYARRPFEAYGYAPSQPVPEGSSGSNKAQAKRV